MKNLFFSILLLILILLSSCKKNDTQQEVFPKKITPMENSQTTLINSSENKNESFINEYNESTSPLINIDDNLLLSYVKNINLDLDADEEQVIIVSPKENKSELKIMILDFNSVRNKYVVTWEKEKKDINYRSFTMHYMDVVGDHNQELIFTAETSDGNQIFDVYRKTHSPYGIRLYYESIFSLTLKGQIELQEKQRSQAYHLGQKNGISFPIVSYEELPDSNSMNKKTFMWNYQDNKYIKAFDENIPIKLLEEQKLNQVFFNDPKAYISFLSGQWNNVNSQDYIIRFDIENSEIILFTDDILETYKWYSFNFYALNKTIDISARNDSVQFITKRFLIKIQNVNRISIEIRDRDNPRDVNQLNGIYTRISDQHIDSTIVTPKPENTNITLIGEYLDTNSSLSFENNTFTLKKDDNISNGIYSIYNFNGNSILELRSLDKNSQYVEINQYKIDFISNTINNQIVNKIVIIKGVVTADFFQSFGEDPLNYVQTIISKTP